MDLPCALCAQRGFQCGTEEKVLGPKALLQCQERENNEREQVVFVVPRSPSIPADEALTDLDRKYLCLVGCTLREDGLFSLPSRYFPYGITGPADMIPVFSLSSKVFRYAYLSLIATDVLESAAHLDVLQYNAKFYKYAKEAIESSSELEIILGSYIMFLREHYQCRLRGQDIAIMLMHFKGLWASVDRFLSRRYQLTPSLIDLIEGVCLYSVLSSHSSHLFVSRITSYLENRQLRETICEILEYVVNVVCSNQLPYQDEITRIETLDVCFNFFLDDVLFWKTRSISPHVQRMVRRSTKCLQQVCKCIINFTTERPRLGYSLSMLGLRPHPLPWAPIFSMPPHFYTMIGYKFIMANIVLNSFFCSNMSQIVEDSLHLCRCYSMLRTEFWLSPSIVLLARGLFWAGMVLTNKVNAEGIDKCFQRLRNTGNKWILAELSALCHRLVELSRSSTRVVRIENTFKLVFKILTKNNSQFFEELMKGDQIQDVDIFHCNYMLLELQMSWWE